MDALGLNNDVTLGGRKFHVQTSYSAPQEKIISNVFINGQVVDSKEVDVENDIPTEEIDSLIKDTHQFMITEMEIIFYISEKVKTVRHAPSANKLGLLFLSKNLYNEAIQHFEIALDIDPEYSEAIVNLGKALIASKSFDKAIDILKKGEVQAPQYADIKNYLGVALIQNGNYKEAVDVLEKALQINPNYRQAHLNLATALVADILHSGGAENPASSVMQSEAVEHLNRAAAGLKENDSPDLEKAKKFVIKGAYQEALDLLLATDPLIPKHKFFDFENEFYLKFMYGGKGKDDGFIDSYIQRLTTIIEEYPEYADIRNNLGVAYLIQCRNLFLKSLEEFRTALKINPNFKKAEKNLKLAENDGKGFLILLRAILK